MQWQCSIILVAIGCYAGYRAVAAIHWLVCAGPSGCSCQFFDMFFGMPLRSNMLTHGVVTSVRDAGCIVSFYNGVKGLLPGAELKCVLCPPSSPPPPPPPRQQRTRLLY
jgi:hypothetical protein